MQSNCRSPCPQPTHLRRAVARAAQMPSHWPGILPMYIRPHWYRTHHECDTASASLQVVWGESRILHDLIVGNGRPWLCQSRILRLSTRQVLKQHAHCEMNLSARIIRAAQRVTRGSTEAHLKTQQAPFAGAIKVHACKPTVTDSGVAILGGPQSTLAFSC